MKYLRQISYLLIIIGCSMFIIAVYLTIEKEVCMSLPMYKNKDNGICERYKDEYIERWIE